MFASVRTNGCGRYPVKPALLLALVCLAGSASGKVVYVNRAAPGGTNNGASWGTAFLTVKAGLAASVSGDEVWVARGTYSETVTLSAGVSVYGGFAGTETEAAQRNWAANPTILDAVGDTQAVVVASSSEGGRLDGFTVRNGGTGVKATSGSVTVANCTITGTAFAAHVTASTATFTNCTVSANTRGIYVYAGATVSVANSVLSGNTAAGGYIVTGGTTTVSNCLVRANNSGFLLPGGKLTAVNCTISGNSADGVYINGGTLTASNSIFAFNRNGISAQIASSPALSHNNVFGNTTKNYMNVTDQTGSNGNISEDPLFVNRAGADFHLGAGSPCIDTGDDAAVAAGALDLDGQPRIGGAGVDMGAYESLPAGFTLSDAMDALRFAAGLLVAPNADVARLNVEAGDPAVTALDAVRIARKARGLEANP